MPKTAVLRVASARPAPVPITTALVKKAYRGARSLFPLSPDRERLAEMTIHSAYALAVLTDVQVQNGSIYDVGPPLGDGGERTKVRIASDSGEHRAKVAEHFAKFLNDDERLQLAVEIIRGRVLLPL